MTNLNVVEILRLGVVGLAFLLAFLAYAILRKEQDLTRPRSMMLAAAYIFMVFSIVMCGLTIFNGIKEKMLANEAAQRQSQVAADTEQRRIEAIPTITWTLDSLNDSSLFQCKANGKTIGAHLDCRTYGTCNNLEGNRRVCAGVYYADAIAREHSQAAARRHD